MRNEINEKPHLVLGLGLAVIFAFSYLAGCPNIEIQWEQSYLKFSSEELLWRFAALLLADGFIYWTAVSQGKKLTKWMTMFHIAFSLFFVITVIFFGCETELLSFSGNFKLKIAGGIFLLAQLVFAVNILKAFFVKK